MLHQQKRDRQCACLFSFALFLFLLFGFAFLARIVRTGLRTVFIAVVDGDLSDPRHALDLLCVGILEERLACTDASREEEQRHIRGGRVVLEC